MKWAFILGSPTISGGSNVIFEHAIRNMERGVQVSIITEMPVKMNELDWHPRAKKLKWETFSEAQHKEYDVLIATWWRTAYEAYRIKAKKYVYFVQSIESKFYDKKELPIINLAEASYMIPFYFITEARWIKKYLKDNYNVDAFLVLNGIDKEVFNTNANELEEKDENKLRVLVEGPINVSFKNVPKAIELSRKSDADEVWLLTSSDIKKYDGVNRVFSRVPLNKTSEIYKSCDVIVKLSYVEGMFGPPLEMFHCGGTAITFDVTGQDEYIINDKNAIVVKTDNDLEVIKALNKLKHDKNYLLRLKKEAISTAKIWNDWDKSSKYFYETISQIIEINNKDNIQSEIERISKFHFNSYIIAENYLNELKFIKAKGIKYKIWERIRRFEKIKKHIPNDIKEKIKLILSLK